MQKRPELSVHPHTRGEYAPYRSVFRLDGGSPPHAWGIHDPQMRRVGECRFTPTRVGNTATLRSNRSRIDGSPPHAWGIPPLAPRKPSCDSVHPHTRGEYAPPANPGRTPAKVHPHTRGEYVIGRDQPRRESGSPPHAWGIRWPARTPGTPSPVHPHTRGEYSTPAPEMVSIPSVHPHTRGEYATRACRLSRPLRFTPTRVGNTWPGRGRGPRPRGSPPHAWGIRGRTDTISTSDTVHPHTRGEYCPGLSYGA